jgi:iron complex transport system permease protein
VVSGSAFVFAVGCCLVIAIISSVKRGSAHSIILAGIAMVFLFDAAAAMLKYVAKDDQLAAITSWAFGTLENAEFSQVEVIAAILAFSLFFLIANSWKLTGVSLGDDKARSLGINVQKLKFETLIVVSLLTAISVSFVGIIGFVGLVAPHVARKLVGDDQRYLIPATCLWGAVLLSAASILSKIVITGVVIPIGIMTSLIGVPFLFALIVKKN